MDDALTKSSRTQSLIPTETQGWPVSTLELILQACNPGKPLQTGDTRYVDLKELRRGKGVQPLQRKLKMLLAPGDYHHQLLCGHRGSGKSTELLALREWADREGFLAVWVEVNDKFGMIELDYSDLFLLAAAVTEQEMQRFGHPLPEEKIRRVLEWFREIIDETTQETKSEIGVEVGAQLGGSLPLSLSSLFAKLTAVFKGTNTHSRKTRDTMRRFPNRLLDFTRDLLQTANEILVKNDKPRGLLLIYDNLDRYDPVNVDAILVRSSHQIRQLTCNAIFTFPISLAYKPISGKVSAEYGPEIPLPMLALRRKSAPWAETVAASEFVSEYVAILHHILEERIVVETLFADPRDADLLVKMSGGVIRDLMQLVTSAATYTEDEARITSEAARSAINDLRGSYMRFLATTPHDYRCLALFARHKSLAAQEENLSDPINRLLFNGCLLEYMEDGQPWHDVHPVLIETEEFRHACSALDNKTSE